MIVIVAQTIMDGTAIRWYATENAAMHRTATVSVSRNGVLVNGYLHEVPAAVLALAQEIYWGWQNDRNAWSDADKFATHRRRGGRLEPIERVNT